MVDIPSYLTSLLTELLCKRKLDLAFVIDQSGSIIDKNPADGSYDNWNLILNFILNIITYFSIDFDETRVAAVTFGTNGLVRFYLRDHGDRDSLRRAITAIPEGIGRTNTYGGLNVMRRLVFTEENGDRPDVPNVAIVLTDGVSTINRELTISEAEAARAAGIRIFSIGVTNDINEDEIRAISSLPQELGRNYWKTPDFLSLNTILKSLQRETCEEPVVPPPKGNSGTLKEALV